MNVIPVWRKGYTGRGVVVSILDDGIEKDHPDLKRNYVSPLRCLYHSLSPPLSLIRSSTPSSLARPSLTHWTLLSAVCSY